MSTHRKSPIKRRKMQQVADLQGNTHKLPSNYPISPSILADFLSKIHGQVVFPGDPDYDAARTEFNPAYPAFPQIIVFCICLSDVRACLQLAQAVGMHAVARSGRHSLAGYSVCDGMVIDTSEMNSVVIDRQAMTATVGAGICFERFNANLESYGLHVPGGGCPTVCVAGYMQGGGYGFTSREFGIHSDNVLSFQMVLADGRLVIANAGQNADLFWAVRGGTGNQFGILIEVTYRVYELGKVWGIRLDWITRDTPKEAALALQAIQDSYIRSPDHNKLGFQTVLGFDSKFQDGLRVMFCAVFNGNEADFEAALAPLMAIPGHQVVTRLQDRYSTVDETLLARIPDIPGPQVKGMSRSAYIARDLELEDWEAIIDFVSNAPNTWTVVDMEAYGGRINEIPASESSFIHRDVTMDFFCDVFWMDEDKREENVQWLQQLMNFIAPYSNGHSYQNYPCREQQDWRWAYFGAAYPSLVWVKQKYDPGNFFHYQQAITPELDDARKNDYQPVRFTDPVIVHEDC